MAAKGSKGFNRLSDDRRQLDLDTQILADFIYELNISRRHQALYPPGHPMVEKTTDTLLALLRQLLEFREQLSFGVAKNALMLEYGWLDKSNPVFSDFANVLFRHGIASLCFRRYPDRHEFIRMNQLLCIDTRTLAARGGIKELLKHRQLPHIDMVPVDYHAFQATEEAEDQNVQLQDQWEEFLQGLMAGSLDPEGRARKVDESLDPQIVAELINRQHNHRDGANSPSYDAAIRSFIQRIEQEPQTGEAHQTLGDDFSGLISHLNPELRRQFLNSTFRSLDGHRDGAEKVLGRLPRELILSSIEDCNNNRLNISSTMLTLLGQLSRIRTEDRPRSVIGNGAAPLHHSAERQIQAIFREEDAGKFIPDHYRLTLDTISTTDQKIQLDHEEQEQLRATLDSQSIERQTAAVIFELMTADPEPGQHESMQRNLLDLGYYFLETGDFSALADLQRRWNDHLEMQRSDIAVFSEERTPPLDRPSFLQDTLDSFAGWEDEQRDAIASYARSVGGPLAELLVERLGDEGDRALRDRYVGILTGMGKAAHEAIFAALQDKRPALLCDLLNALEAQSAATILKPVYPLLDHPDPDVRRDALRILFKYNRPKADQLLLGDLHHSDPKRQLNAAQIADYSRDRTIFNSLLSILNRDDLSEASLPLKCQIVSTLGRIDKVQALPHLQKALKATGLFHGQLRKRLKREIVVSLGNYSATAAAELLSGLSRSGNRELSGLAAEQLQRRQGGEP